MVECLSDQDRLLVCIVNNFVNCSVSKYYTSDGAGVNEKNMTKRVLATCKAFNMYTLTPCNPQHLGK